MKYLFLIAFSATLSVPSFAQGQQSSVDDHCCKTGQCRNIKACPGVFEAKRVPSNKLTAGGGSAPRGKAKGSKAGKQ